jgi:hypothetical protein
VKEQKSQHKPTARGSRTKNEYRRIAELPDYESSNRACNTHRTVEKGSKHTQCRPSVSIIDASDCFHSERWEYQRQSTPAKRGSGESQIVTCGRPQNKQSGGLNQERHHADAESTPTVDGACEQQAGEDETDAEQNQCKRRIGPVPNGKVQRGERPDRGKSHGTESQPQSVQ